MDTIFQNNLTDQFSFLTYFLNDSLKISHHGSPTPLIYNSSHVYSSMDSIFFLKFMEKYQGVEKVPMISAPRIDEEGKLKVSV